METIGRELMCIPAAKLAPPVAPQAEVPRVTFCEKATSNGFLARLIVVQAPAGFGKTTALRQLRERLWQSGTHSAWLRLDPADNDVPRFLYCLAAALAAVGICPAAQGAEFDVIEILSSHVAPFAIFFDEFENIHEPAVFALVRSVIDALPRGAQVIIGTRRQPKLGLARLRAQGELVELDHETLRFSMGETRHYLRLRHQQSLSADAVRRLHDKTEGWVTALWLASISIERASSYDDVINGFSGTTRTVADYFAEDVLDHQTPPIRDFLLKTSILRDIDPSLCQALMPDVDVDAMLKSITDQNLFLASPGPAKQSYRYHSLFANFLRARLLREHAGEVQALHLKAAHWYASHDRPVPAIDHAIAANDFRLMIELMEKQVQDFLEAGRLRLLARWFNSIPEQALSDYPGLRSARVWARLFTDGPMSAASELNDPSYAESCDRELKAHLNAQRPLWLAMKDLYDEALSVGRTSLTNLPTCNRFADSVLGNVMADVLTVMGDGQEARRLIDAARRTHSGSMFSRMYAESLEGILDLQAGRLRQATARFRMALNATKSQRANFGQGNAWAGLLYAEALYEANDFSAAEQLVNAYLPLICDIGLPDQMCSGHLSLARIAYCRGDVSEAVEVLGTLEYLGHHRGLPRLVATAKLERGKFLLLQGNGQAAKEELTRANDPDVWARVGRQRLPANELDYLALAEYRWQIHFGDVRAVLAELERHMTEALDQQRYRRALKLRVLYSLALQRNGDYAGATEAIAAVVRQAAPEGFLRLIADEGPQVGQLVQRFKTILEEMPARQSDPIVMEYLERLMAVFGPLAPLPQEAGVVSSMMEPLTRKEIQVLQLTSDGCSNSDMVAKLRLSDSTVRTHLRNINTKLNAHSRSEAVAVARRIGLIR